MIQYHGFDISLKDSNQDGYLIDASSNDSNQLYLTGFDAPDPFITLYTPQESRILVSELEYRRAIDQSQVDIVRKFSDYNFSKNLEKLGPIGARMNMISEFIFELLPNPNILVPANFPIETADGLREMGVQIKPDVHRNFSKVRSCKSTSEINYIKQVQKATEAAMLAAETILQNSTIDGEFLYFKGGILTSETVKEKIALTLLKWNCHADNTIVSSGKQGSDPHNSGSGPLMANSPIIIDIFPRDNGSKYYADMTRTMVKGIPDSEVWDYYNTTLDAMECAFTLISPGTSCKTIHDKVCDIYESSGYPTLRSDPSTNVGFIHSTGHGVGLDIHESPRIGPGDSIIEPGNIITIEPGLYDPLVGGMRIEDLILVTKNGFKNLTNYSKKLLV